MIQSRMIIAVRINQATTKIQVMVSSEKDIVDCLLKFFATMHDSIDVFDDFTGSQHNNDARAV